MATAGIVLTGIGVAVVKMLLIDSHLHDFMGMLVVFATAGYIVMQVPGVEFYDGCRDTGWVSYCAEFV